MLFYRIIHFENYIGKWGNIDGRSDAAKNIGLYLFQML